MIVRKIEAEDLFHQPIADAFDKLRRESTSQAIVCRTPVEPLGWTVVNVLSPLGTSYAGFRIYDQVIREQWAFYEEMRSPQTSRTFQQWLSAAAVTKHRCSDSLRLCFGNFHQHGVEVYWPRVVSTDAMSWAPHRQVSLCLEAEFEGELFDYLEKMELQMGVLAFNRCDESVSLASGDGARSVEGQALWHFGLRLVRDLQERVAQLKTLAAYMERILASGSMQTEYRCVVHPSVPATGGIQLSSKYPEFAGNTAELARTVLSNRIRLAGVLAWPQFIDSLSRYLESEEVVDGLQDDIVNEATALRRTLTSRYPIVLQRPRFFSTRVGRTEQRHPV